MSHRFELMQVEYSVEYICLSWDLGNTPMCYFRQCQWYHASVHSFNHSRFNTHLLSSKYFSGIVEGSKNAGRYILDSNSD